MAQFLRKEQMSEHRGALGRPGSAIHLNELLSLSILKATLAVLLIALW